MNVVDYTAAFLTEIVAAVNANKEYAFTAEFQNGEGKVKIEAPKMQLLREEEADNNGTQQFDIPFRFNGNWSDKAVVNNEITVTFSPAS